MAKISDNSMDALFDGLTTESAEQHNASTTPRKTSTTTKQEGKKETFLVRFNPITLGKARLISGAHKIPISEIINFALDDYVKRYEKKHGVIELSAHKSASDLLK